MQIKKLKFLLVILALICGASVVSAATSDDSISTSRAIDEIERALTYSDKKKFRAVDDNSELMVSKNAPTPSTDANDASKLEIDAQDPEINQKSVERVKLAYDAMVIGQYEVAMEYYKRVLASEPKNQYAQFGLAVCYHKLGQYKQAKNLYYKLLKSDYENKDEVIGNMLELIVEESPNDAVYILAKLSAGNPSSSYILARSAMSYDKINKTNQAILLLNRAVELEPDNLQYKFNLAVIYDKNENYQSALGFYQDVINGYSQKNGTDDSGIPIAQVKQRIEYIKNKV
jgi:tetratricopeptide (TPR) repeat protein